jgi:hypothetical protein
MTADTPVHCAATPTAWALLLPSHHSGAVLAGPALGCHVWTSPRIADLRRSEGRLGGALALALDRAGYYVLAAYPDNAIRLFTTSVRHPLMEVRGHDGLLTALTMADPTSLALSASRDSTLIVWDLVRGAERRVLRGHAGPVLCVAVDGDARRALSGAADGEVLLWDLESGSLLHRLKAPWGSATFVCLQGDRAFAIANGIPHAWDAASGNYLGPLGARGGSMTALRASADGRRVIVSGEDGEVWICEGNGEAASLGHCGAPVVAVDVLPEGTFAASATAAGCVWIWDIEQRTCAATLDPEAGHTSSGPAGARTEVRRAPQPSAKPLPLDENVQFTAFRPAAVQPARWYPLLAFAHLSKRPPDAPPDAPDPIQEVHRQAKQVLGELAAGYQNLVQDTRQAVPREGEITFVLDLPGFDVNPLSRSFRWQESVHREEFRICAPPKLDGTTTHGTLTVFLGSIILAEIGLAIPVDSHVQPPAKDAPLAPQSAKPYRKIFASYSHRDAAIVEQYEAFARSLGDRYLRDCADLQAGGVWRAELQELIRQADVFQLFWSSNSMRSAFVEEEWKFALGLNVPHFVRPTYWEDPLPTWPERGLPPKELTDLHFHFIGAGPSPPRMPAHGAGAAVAAGGGGEEDVELGAPYVQAEGHPPSETPVRIPKRESPDISGKCPLGESPAYQGKPESPNMSSGTKSFPAGEEDIIVTKSFPTWEEDNLGGEEADPLADLELNDGDAGTILGSLDDDNDLGAGQVPLESEEAFEEAFPSLSSAEEAAPMPVACDVGYPAALDDADDLASAPRTSGKKLLLLIVGVLAGLGVSLGLLYLALWLLARGGP